MSCKSTVKAGWLLVLFIASSSGFPFENQHDFEAISDPTSVPERGSEEEYFTLNNQEKQLQNDAPFGERAFSSFAAEASPSDMHFSPFGSDQQGQEIKPASDCPEFAPGNECVSVRTETAPCEQTGQGTERVAGEQLDVCEGNDWPTDFQNAGFSLHNLTPAPVYENATE